jgi:nitrite reductase/ring-hydroxylating ferredoxin subunit
MPIPDDASALTRRLVEHVIHGTTDLASATFRVPVSTYTDPKIWRQEVDNLFKHVPLALALSVEVPTPGDFKASAPLGLPVVIIRGRDGEARAFLNVCRHRGARVVEPGAGHAARFTCPYHAWVYDDRGALCGMYGSETFGAIDRSEYALQQLETEERHGFVWAVLHPHAALDVDRWLGAFADHLHELDLASWTIFDQKELEGPGWKVAYDGYLEAYHLQALHATTVGADTMANLMVVDAFGPHQRIVLAQRSLPRAHEVSDAQRLLVEHCSPIHAVFPNLSVAGAWQDRCVVSQIFPGPTPDRSVTVQTILTRDPPVSRPDRMRTRQFSGLVRRAVRDEDYAAGFGVEAGLPSGANTHLTFGRNELAVQHFHRALDEFLDTAATDEGRL